MSDEIPTTDFEKVCQLVADWGNYRFSHTLYSPLTAKDVFNYSPSGELFMIYDLYAQATHDKEFMALKGNKPNA